MICKSWSRRGRPDAGHGLYPAGAPDRPRAAAGARQTLLFSATMPNDVRKLAADFLDEPIEVAVTPVASTVERVEQRVIHVAAREKPALLAEMLGDTTTPGRWCSPAPSAARTVLPSA